MSPAVDDDGNEKEVEIEEELETEPLRNAPDPGKPSSKQMDEHRLTHVPYRMLCKWCNLGRGRGLQHRRSAGSDIPVVGIDYFFITKGGVKKRDELEEEYPSDHDGNKALFAARERGDVVKCIVLR